MPESTPLTPGSSPGSIPSADTVQTCPPIAFIKLTAFISGAPWTTLSAIMNIESEEELRARLARIDASDPCTKPSTSVITTCQNIHKWLKQHGRRSAVSKDIIPLSLLLLLKFRIQNDGTGALSKFNEGVWIVVALKIAWGNTSDSWMRLKSWEKHTGVPAKLIKSAEPLFLEVLNWRTWIREEVFSDFIARIDMLWDMVLKEEES